MTKVQECDWYFSGQEGEFKVSKADSLLISSDPLKSACLLLPLVSEQTDSEILSYLFKFPQLCGFINYDTVD